MAKKKIIAQQEDFAVARAIANYFSELGQPIKIKNNDDAIGFFIVQHGWAQLLLSVLTYKHRDKAFQVFVEVLGELGFVDPK